VGKKGFGIMKDKVRDLRVKEKFIVDDNYLNGYARVCGIYATGVYMALCRHASKYQVAFPGIELIAKKLKISRSSVIRGITKLEEFNIIRVSRGKNTKGQQAVNTYALLDKSCWKAIRVSPMDSENENPSLPQNKTESTTDINRVSEMDCKETQIKETQLRSKKPPLCPYSSIVDLYHEVLPELPCVVKLTETRKKQLNTRWKESKKWQSLDMWREYFEHIRESPFLMGKVRSNGRPFKGDLEWFTKESNFIKVIEGKYHAD
jgi:hypothetical protein